MSLYELSLTRRVPNQGGCFTPNRTTAWRFLRGANGPVKTKRRHGALYGTRFAAQRLSRTGHTPPRAPIASRTSPTWRRSRRRSVPRGARESHGTDAAASAAARPPLRATGSPMPHRGAPSGISHFVRHIGNRGYCMQFEVFGARQRVTPHPIVFISRPAGRRHDAAAEWLMTVDAVPPGKAVRGPGVRTDVRGRPRTDERTTPPGGPMRRVGRVPWAVDTW